MSKSKIFKKGAILSVLCLLIVACLAVPQIRGFIAHAADEIGRDFVVHYYNNDVQDDGIANNNYNFGPNRFEQANEAVKKGDAKDIQEWVATYDGKGDFFESISVDPALCAAIALDMDERLNFPDEDKILIDEQNELIGRRADAAHLHFLSDHSYWERAVKLIKERLTSGEITVRELTGYTSSMYMWNNHLEANKPSVIVRESVNSGGHFVEFDLGKPGIVRYRLECGYQPVDTDEYWPTPPQPPIPDNPEPPTPPDDTPLQPKDPDAGPQAQVPDDTPGKEDFGGGQNHDPITDITPEPQSPSSYTPPAAPSEQPREEGKTSDGHQDASTGTESGSRTVDDTNGTTETHGGQDYTVVAGDGQNHTDLGEVQEQHSSDTVEPALKDDGTNQGDLDPSAVE